MRGKMRKDRTPCALLAAVTLEGNSVLSDKAAPAAHPALYPKKHVPTGPGDVLRGAAQFVMPANWK